MSLLNKDYSENGTNVKKKKKANEIHLLKRELLAEIKSKFLLYNIKSEHIKQVIVEILQ